jgi:hypothetical protein
MAFDLFALALVLVFQVYGGQAPWGMERPVTIHGEVRRGEAFERAIGGGLSFRLVPTEAGWRIEVGDGKDDFTRCATGPFHGLTAMDIEGDANRDVDGDGRRWFDFVLTAGDQERQCTWLDEALNDPERFRTTTKYLSTKPQNRAASPAAAGEDHPDERRLRVDDVRRRTAIRRAQVVAGRAATSFRPATPAGSACPLTHRRRRPLRSPAATINSAFLRQALRTSTELRADQRDAQYVFSGGARIPSAGPQKRIWGAYRVLEGRCGRYLMFFVGTKQQYQRARVAGPPSNIRCD